MIWATVLEQQSGKASRKRGRYVFVQLPGSGDHIQIFNDRQKFDLMQVLYVQHTPKPSDNPNDLSEWDGPFSQRVAEGALRNVGAEPVAHVVCELIAELP